jgi:outer membrane murein-binding lipoprotein Lpp
MNMDPTYIIGTVITIATLGFSLYASFKKNIAAHKTTQGKIDSVITTAQKHESEINQLSSDVQSLIAYVKQSKP